MILRALDLELHRTVNLSKQRMVTTHADIVTRMELRATLANDDATGGDRGVTKNLYTKTLSLGITTVAGRTATLFMCHFLTLLKVDIKPR